MNLCCVGEATWRWNGQLSSASQYLGCLDTLPKVLIPGGVLLIVSAEKDHVTSRFHALLAAGSTTTLRRLFCNPRAQRLPDFFQ